MSQVVVPPTKRQLSNAARDDGISRAIAHADAVHPDWGDRAFAELHRYIAPMHAGARLTGEEIREFAELHGVPRPPDKRAWGNVMLRAARAGLIRKIGWTTASDPKTHCNPISLWEMA